MSDHHEGGCLCGDIRYQFSGPPQGVYHCHCTVCRRASAGAFVTWVGVDAENACLTQGAVKIHASSEDGRRGFCPTCGAQISFFFESEPGTLYFTVGTLDDADVVAPEGHAHTGETVRWLHIDDGLPEYAANPPEIE